MMLPLEHRAITSLALFYADPGSGALLWQLIGSFFIGLLFYLRRFAVWLTPKDGSKRSDDAIGDQK